MHSKITSYKRDGWIEVIHLKNCPRTYKPHSHVSTYTVGIVLEGSVVLNRILEENITANNYFIISPYQAHSLMLRGRYELLSICINTSVTQEAEEKQLETLLLSTLCLYALEFEKRAIIETAKDLHRLARQNEKKQKTLKSIELIENHPECSYALQDIAKQSLTSKAPFIKTFKDETGVTPHKFLLQRRVRRAHRALESGEDTASVAANLGFHDQSHLHKCFKDIVGMTPGDYRKSTGIISFAEHSRLT
ncbi:MAG: helix-turn-helix domain-containing protein [Raoultibacter sp.]|jgi:AraC-like DNA-binding protein